MFNEFAMNLPGAYVMDPYRCVIFGRRVCLFLLFLKWLAIFFHA